VKLHVNEWGEPAAPTVVCLHGVTGHGRRFRRLAEERLARRFHVLAPDLRGHGRSVWDEPWTLEAQLEDLLDTVTEPAAWVGHSLGGRLTMEVTAARPGLVERAVLLDPAVWVPPEFAEQLAEEERPEKAYATVDEAIAARLVELFSTPREILEEEMCDHLVKGDDRRLRFRYSQPAAAQLYLELAKRPPPFERLRVPTLLLVGAESKLVSAAEAERYREALGDLLRVAVTPGGHSPLWDAFEETAACVERFLAAG
jgi:lipase